MQIGLQPATREAYELLHSGSIAFSRMEETGLNIDVKYLDAAIARTKVKIAELQQSLKASKEFKEWQKAYGREMGLGSRVQLADVIFNRLGHKRNPFMGESNDVAAFEHLRLPFLKDYQDLERLKKALATNLYGLKRETINGVLRPSFNLAGGIRSGEGAGGAESYRSSSNRPNLHNQPTRNKLIAEIVRSSVIPGEGYEFIEADYGTQEVRTSYFYHHDPKLLYDVLHGDMHRDRSLELFLLTPEELGPTSGGTPGKQVRDRTKNLFVFRQFYGGTYFQAAPDLWDAISLAGLKTAQGLSMFDHLKAKGITRLGTCDPELEPEKDTFEYLVQQVERKMWDENYTVYKQWKCDWWERYQKLGGVNYLTGFRLFGVFRRNQILCDPIQGVAFHILLWSLIQIQKELLRLKMKTKIVCQIHDSILLRVWKPERKAVLAIVRDFALERVVKHWPWITCPLALEFEICESSWWDKIPLKENAA